MSSVIDRLNRILFCSEERGLDETECRTMRDAIAEIEQLRKERDEARRAACKGEAIIRLQRNRVHRESEEVVLVAKEISVERGWDCFKENTNKENTND